MRPPSDVILAALAAFAFTLSMLALGVSMAHGDVAGMTVFSLGGLYSGRYLHASLF